MTVIMLKKDASFCHPVSSGYLDRVISVLERGYAIKKLWLKVEISLVLGLCVFLGYFVRTFFR